MRTQTRFVKTSLVKNEILVEDQRAEETDQSVRSNSEDRLLNESESLSFNATNRS